MNNAFYHAKRKVEESRMATKEELKTLREECRKELKIPKNRDVLIRLKDK